MTQVLRDGVAALAKPLQPKSELEASKLKMPLSDGRLPQAKRPCASFSD